MRISTVATFICLGIPRRGNALQNGVSNEARAHCLWSHPLLSISDATVCFNPVGAQTRTAGLFIAPSTKLGHSRRGHAAYRKVYNCTRQRGHRQC